MREPPRPAQRASLGLHALAALAALAAPVARRPARRRGERHRDGSLARVDQIAVGLAVAVVAQTGLTWAARRSSFILGETVFAELREQFVARAVNLPLSTVERAGTGDLVARTTNDVEALSHVVRFGIPSLFVASMTVAMTVGRRAVHLAAGDAWPSSPALPFYWFSTRRYLRHAADGYLWERATYAALNGVVPRPSTARGPIDALVAGRGRAGSRFHEALRECYRRRALHARACGCGGSRRWCSATPCRRAVAVALGRVARDRTATSPPARPRPSRSTSSRWSTRSTRCSSWLDEIQVGATSLARVIGVGRVPPDREATGETPDGDAT